MAIIEKGKKGFQSKPTELKKVKRFVYYLTNKERILLDEYCTKNNTKSSLLIRELLSNEIGF